MLEGGDRFGELLNLSVGRTQEIPGVGVVGVDFGYAMEGVDGGACIRRVFVKEAEVVPGVRVFRIVLGGFFQQRFGVVYALEVEQGHSSIDSYYF